MVMLPKNRPHRRNSSNEEEEEHHHTERTTTGVRSKRDPRPKQQRTDPNSCLTSTSTTYTSRRHTTKDMHAQDKTFTSRQVGPNRGPTLEETDSIDSQALQVTNKNDITR
jgi:hypothetical protein